jgi:hypothetical protein
MRAIFQALFSRSNPFLIVEPWKDIVRIKSGTWLASNFSVFSNRADRLINPVEVVNDLRKSPIGDIQTLPQIEKVVRPLVNLTTEDRQAVWQESCQKAAAY